MQIPTIKQMLKSNLLIAGLLFFLVNSFYSYPFYIIKDLRMVVFLTGLCIIVIWSDIIFAAKTDKKIPWKQVVIISLPLLATFPGFLLHKGAFNYNFQHELTNYIVLFVWVFYIIRGVYKKEDLYPLN